MNMPAKIIAVGLLATFLVAPAFQAVAAEKIATVNMETLFQGYYKTAVSDAAFKKQKDAFNARAEELANEVEAIKKRREELQNKTLNIALNDAAREQARKDLAGTEALFRDKTTDLQNFLVDKDKELGEKYLALRAEIVEEISKFVAAQAKANGIDLVMDISGLTRNYIPVVIYASDAFNMTETILKELNRGHEGEAPAAGK